MNAEIDSCSIQKKKSYSFIPATNTTVLPILQTYKPVILSFPPATDTISYFTNLSSCPSLLPLILLPILQTCHPVLPSCHKYYFLFYKPVILSFPPATDTTSYFTNLSSCPSLLPLILFPILQTCHPVFPSCH